MKSEWINIGIGTESEYLQTSDSQMSFLQNDNEDNEENSSEIRRD